MSQRGVVFMFVAATCCWIAASSDRTVPLHVIAALMTVLAISAEVELRRRK